jgi:hypothetical protein
VEEDEHWLVDMGSTNGTYFGDSIIAIKPHRYYQLVPGKKIRFGRVITYYEIPDTNVKSTDKLPKAARSAVVVESDDDGSAQNEISELQRVTDRGTKSAFAPDSDNDDLPPIPVKTLKDDNPVVIQNSIGTINKIDEVVASPCLPTGHPVVPSLPTSSHEPFSMSSILLPNESITKQKQSDEVKSPDFDNSAPIPAQKEANSKKSTTKRPAKSAAKCTTARKRTSNASEADISVGSTTKDGDGDISVTEQESNVPSSRKRGRPKKTHSEQESTPSRLVTVTCINIWCIYLGKRIVFKPSANAHAYFLSTPFIVK